MSHEAHIHQAQTQILRELLFVNRAGFAALQKPTGLTSDHFKFHIKRLLELGYIEKASTSEYRLSASGKEYANKLDTANNTLERQPKTAVILVAEAIVKGKLHYVLQERHKHPYFGFWGFPGGKIRWGETILQAAARELNEETGLKGTFRHQGVYHEHVIEAETGVLLEDKIFHIVHCSNLAGKLIPAFEGGRNSWLTLEQAHSQAKRYASFDIEASIGLGKAAFVESTQYYSKTEF
ncbi:MAG TPA: NUDIX domain-containing protein [Candidatus Saccharimonadia bacterium]|nr:NUDIX domain-containing protein [Candidatus Saccharimonadia bacterium]